MRDGKGQKDRLTLLPARVVEALMTHIEGVRLQHATDVRAGNGSVELPNAIERKYPRAPWEWGWQWVFTATRSYKDAETGRLRRHHLHETVLQKAVREAVVRAGLSKPATCHTLRHCFATHLLEEGYDIRTIKLTHDQRSSTTTGSFLEIGSQRQSRAPGR